MSETKVEFRKVHETKRRRVIGGRPRTSEHRAIHIEMIQSSPRNGWGIQVDLWGFQLKRSSLTAPKSLSEAKKLAARMAKALDELVQEVEGA